MASAKFVLAVLWAVIITGLCRGESEIARLEAYYYGKCNQTGDLRKFEKLRTDAYEMYKYAEFAINLLPDSTETFCKNHRPKLIERADELKNDLNQCLPAGRHFFGKFVKDSIVEILHFLCHNNAEKTRRFFTQGGPDCMKTLEEPSSSNLDNCFNRIFAPSSNFITKVELCEDIAVARKCFERLVDDSCRIGSMRQLNREFFTYVSKPCSSSYMAISANALLLFVILSIVSIVS
uniref:DUF19 domain-containing protein n=1 Tax=Dendroctonus ponderosae TaxID=77166 RepID=A0AAR5PQK2_DENPD